jgi:TrmH family RNA methyltransferase
VPYLSMHITSLQNDRVKQLVKLREDKRQRQRDGLMLVEGWDEINLALAAGYVPQTLITCPELAKSEFRNLNSELLIVTPPVLEKISSRENPDGWMAVFTTPVRLLADLQLREQQPMVIVAEAVEKPGNLGAILRTADAAGVDALLVCDPRADLYGPNVVRASRGTVFSVPLAQGSSQEVYDFLKQHGLRIVAATPGAERIYTAEDLRGPIAIAVGTEDAGLTDFWLQSADATVLIPMSGKVNSLNVSIATALIVYEAVRQRGT